jgi:hypothetical protein
MWWSLLLAGCRGGPFGVEAETGAPDQDTAFDTQSPAPPAGTTAGFDCGTPPAGPLAIRDVPGATGGAGPAFDGAGFAYDAAEGEIRRVAFDGTWDAYASFDDPALLLFLADGTLAVEDGAGDLWRLIPGGEATPVAVGLFAAALVVGPDGGIYAGTLEGVVRVDPATGDRTTVVTGIGVTALDFSSDLAGLFLGTSDGTGTVWLARLDGSPPEAYANTGAGSLHDALVVDWCGNAVVSDANQARIVRIDAEGEVELLLDLAPERHARGMAWGSGVGGWRADAIYAAQPDAGAVEEVSLGIPGRGWDGG